MQFLALAELFLCPCVLPAHLYNYDYRSNSGKYGTTLLYLFIDYSICEMRLLFLYSAPRSFPPVTLAPSSPPSLPLTKNPNLTGVVVKFDLQSLQLGEQLCSAKSTKTYMK